MNTDGEFEDLNSQVRQYVEDFFGIQWVQPPGTDRAHATLTKQNQPEFYADAPWRLEKDQDSIPVLFMIRDGNLRWPALGPWQISRLQIAQQRQDKSWNLLRGYTRSRLPGVDSEGLLDSGLWTFSTRIPRNMLDKVPLDGTVRLRLSFFGRYPPGVDAGREPIHRYLQVHLAAHPLPCGRAASGGEARHWFYGDTHYHSAFTNNLWEFGNPVRDARNAARAIGLDWMMITDHSCDLDERDEGPAGPTRFEQLRKLVSRRSISNHRFRVILGEEITLRKGKWGYLHMLVFGGLLHMIEGGFFHDEDNLTKKWLDRIMDKLVNEGGYPQETIEQLFDPVHMFESVLAALPTSTLAFAAHPYTVAQPPFIDGTWDKKQLTHPRLTGHEFWNGRSRRKTKILEGPTDDPFLEPEWNDPQALAEADRKRVAQMREWVEKRWEPILEDGVDEWAPSLLPPAQRPVFIAGSDADGDFNYSVGVGWTYKQHGMISDNALGRARTAVHLPEHTSHRVPPIRDVLAALRKGSCVVTDGPVLAFRLRQGGREAGMGEVLQIGGGDPRLEIVLHTSDEFGSAEAVDLVGYMKRGRGRRVEDSMGLGQTRTVTLKGERGYVRAAVETQGPDGERFCCFTNPIWLWNPGGDKVDIQVRATVQKG